jgi:hypothetical protein
MFSKWFRSFKVRIHIQAFLIRHRDCPGFKRVGFLVEGHKVIGWFCPLHNEGMGTEAGRIIEINLINNDKKGS